MTTTKLKSASDIKVERWEAQDYVITGLGIQPPSVYSKREADVIVAYVKFILPIIQLNAARWGAEQMAENIGECQGLLPIHAALAAEHIKTAAQQLELPKT